MPHLIIECSEAALREAWADEGLSGLHQTMFKSGLFKADHIKVRLHPVEDYLVGGEKKPFIHAQLRIRPGRSTEQKKTLSGQILGFLRSWSEVEVITVEVVDLDDSCYSKWQA